MLVVKYLHKSNDNTTSMTQNIISLHTKKQMLLIRQSTKELHIIKFTKYSMINTIIAGQEKHWPLNLCKGKSLTHFKFYTCSRPYDTYMYEVFLIQRYNNNKSGNRTTIHHCQFQCQGCQISLLLQEVRWVQPHYKDNNIILKIVVYYC